MKASELPLASDGSLYHIRLTPDTLADRVVLVGDPGRVDMFKSLLDSIEHESHNRELHAITGLYRGQRVTVLSTGMGCDNIDIVMTELDAAADGRHLQIVRVGTCGSLQADIDCGQLVASQLAIGMDGLMNYYQEWVPPMPEMDQRFMVHMGLNRRLAQPYCVQGSPSLLGRIAPDMHHAITATAPGFYGPQGRTVRLHPAIADLNQRLATFSYSGIPVVNLEMETSAIYGFAHLMGHEALTVCLVIANRPLGTFLSDYHDAMLTLGATVLDRLV